MGFSFLNLSHWCIQILKGIEDILHRVSINEIEPIDQDSCGVAARSHAGDGSSLTACVKRLNLIPHLLNQIL